MRPFSLMALTLAIGLSLSLRAETAPSPEAPPQTARQALIEMFFGEAPDHFERHLADVTRQSMHKLEGANGQNMAGFLSMLAMERKAGRERIETFDTGSTFLSVTGAAAGNYDKLELTVDRDDLVSGEDQIELTPHGFKDGKEENLLPLILSFTFSMKMESGVWRLTEVGAAARFPIANPDFLKAMEERQLHQNEQMALLSMNSVVAAEKSYQTAQGNFACKLSALGSAGKETGSTKRAYLFDSQLASGKKNGYVFAISECDTSHYRVVAEPATPDSGQRAFCSDESGTVRASADGKAATCVASGEVVKQAVSTALTPHVTTDGRSFSGTAPVTSSGASSGNSQPIERVRISRGVAAGLIVSKVPPIYPAEAKSARIQGTVVMKAVINKTGDVVSLELISGHPVLAPAALEAVKQWKYRPYLLNGNAVNVEAEVVVYFSLTED